MSDVNTPQRAPLDGTRVLQVGDLLGARWGATMLADLGADVVQVVDTSDSSLARRRRTWSDRNARVIEIDRSAPAGQDVYERLVRWAEFVIDGTPGPELQDIVAGLDGRRPVVCAVDVGIDDVPPAAAELLLQAWSGCMDITGDPDGPPSAFGAPLAGMVTGVYVAAAVLARLAEGGDYPDPLVVSMLDATVSLLSYMAVSFFATGVATGRLGTGHPTIYPYNAFVASDGEIVVAAFTQRFWRQFCEAVGRPDLPTDERFADFAARLLNKSVLTETLDPIMATRTVAEWVERIESADVPCGPVMTVSQAVDHPQTTHRGSTPLVAGSDRRTVGSPFRFEYADGSIYRPPARSPRIVPAPDVVGTEIAEIHPSEQGAP